MPPVRPRNRLYLPLIALAFPVPAASEVTFERDGDTLTKVVIGSGKGRLEISRKLWANTVAITESGKLLSLTDPFMYSARTTLPGGAKGGGYWNKPEVFDLWQVEEVRDPNHPNASIVKIVVEPPGVGLRKEVTIAVDAGETIAYVYNRIVATQDVQLLHDRETIYLTKPADYYQVWVDGKEQTPAHQKSVPLNRHLVFQHKATQASAAVVFLDRACQRYPQAESRAFGSVMFYADEKANGADCSWDKGSGAMDEGDIRVQQYLLVWGDGDLRSRVAELSAKALASELSDRVHSLPEPAAMEDLLLPSDELRADEVEQGVWLPLRTQPTKSTATYQHSTYQSPYNALQAKKMLEGFDEKKPMLLVRGRFGRLVIGVEDGLIHGMRPRVLAESFQGSYLREHAEGWDPKGTLEVLESGRNRLQLRWEGGGAAREITVRAGGLIQTKWTEGPDNLVLFTGCHPYHFMATSAETPVRFSQLTQRRRPLEATSSLALFGYRRAALEVKARGLTAQAEEIWLDSGELGWEWAVAYRDRHELAANASVHGPFGKWVRRNAALTYLAGGAVRKVDFTVDAADYQLDYRLSLAGDQVLDALEQTTFERPRLTQRLSALLPAGGRQIRVSASDPSRETVRIWPNEFHGWELRPLKLVQTNPMPVTYELTVTSPTATGIEFAIEKRPWMDSAMVESDPVTAQLAGYENLQTPKYRQQPFWEARPPSVTVAAGEAKTVLLRVQPIEDTLGDYEFALSWRAGEASGSRSLRVRVVPSSLVDPYGNPLASPDDFRHFGHTGGTTHPTYFRWYYPGATREEEDEFLRLVGEDALRKGYWIRDHGFLRNYITAYTQNGEGASGRQKEYFAKPPDEFVQQLRRDTIMREARFPYRYRVYLADEIWEILGGYKGRRYMPIPEVARWTRDLIMGCPTPCWYSFQQPGIDDEYQTKLPNDIAELFYYCGRDEAVQTYVHRLVEPRLRLIEKWKQDPVCMKRAGTDDIRPLFSFWISGQLHVTDYPTMRRQHWYAKHNGIDLIMFWVFRQSGMLYANRIGCNSVLSAGLGQVLMTDRSLAWHDLREDMARITLVRLLKEDADEATRAQVEALEKQAFEASQANEFDLARDCLARAVKLMRPDLVGLVGPHFYTSVKSEPLEDLFARDAQLRDGPGRKRAVVHKLKGGHRPAPALNATLDNAYLEEGAKLGGFLLLNTHAKPDARTEVYLAWDDEKLYALYDCGEPDMAKLRATPALERDSASLFGDDCVELFVDRTGTGDTFVQFALSAGGGRYDGRVVWKEDHGKRLPTREDKEWNPDYEATVAAGESGWSAEWHLPWSTLGGPPKPGEAWRMNFARERKPKSELSMWSPQQGGFGDAAQFGEVQFVE